MATDLSAIEADIALVQAAADQAAAATAWGTAIKNAVESADMLGTATIPPNAGTCEITLIIAALAPIVTDIEAVQAAADQPAAATASGMAIKNVIETQVATGTTLILGVPGTCELTVITTALAAIVSDIETVQAAATQAAAKTALAEAIQNGILALVATGIVDGGAGTCEITSVL